MMMILLVIILIIIFGTGKSWFKDTKKENPKSDEALENLNLRFAKGEISEEEYEKIKKLITKN